MNAKIFSLVSIAFTVVAGLLAVLLPSGTEMPEAVALPAIDAAIATSSPTAMPEAASTSEKTAPVPAPVPKKIPKPVPAPVVNPPVASPPVSTSTQNNTIGTTTLAIRSVPLLSGGTAHAGDSVAISYLQITNIGEEGAVLKGFWVRQIGTAPAESVIIGLSTVDDKGGSRGFTGGSGGSAPFQNGSALAPTDAYFAPGQMRLFTIKAVMAGALSAHIGTQLMIEVSSIETSAAVKGQFPIRGTTWTIAE